MDLLCLGLNRASEMAGPPQMPNDFLTFQVSLPSILVFIKSFTIVLDIRKPNQSTVFFRQVILYFSGCGHRGISSNQVSFILWIHYDSVANR